MSRIGRLPITLPEGVEVELKGSEIKVSGPGGHLSRSLHPDMRVERSDGTLTVSRPSDAGPHRALHGLTRTLVANMVEGVTKGYSRELELIGVGYRVTKAGDDLVLALGYSHPVRYDAPAGITLEVPDATHIRVKGIDKEMVGQVAAKLRSLRPPEPYKGKGVLYRGEKVRRKAGKSGKTTGTAKA